MRARVPVPNEQGLCCYCFRPLHGNRVLFNGAYAHAGCAAARERLIMGEDAMPGLAEHQAYVDGLEVFIGRLGKEAAALGIDRQRLAQAIGRAADGAR